jgi:hypothetical protein
MTAKEFTIGRERDAEGNMLVVIDGEQRCSVESLKSIVDGEVEREILRKLRAAGVSLTLLDGQPQINVPAAAAHLVKVEGQGKPGFRLPEVAFTDAVDGTRLYDPRKDPSFPAAVEAVVRDAQKRRAI